MCRDLHERSVPMQAAETLQRPPAAHHRVHGHLWAGHLLGQHPVLQGRGSPGGADCGRTQPWAETQPAWALVSLLALGVCVARV